MVYSKFSATDAKRLHALVTLNIYFGGTRAISQTAFGEFMRNLTYQALSQENDDIFLSFEEGINLAHSNVNTFVETENRQFKMASQINEQISDKLDTKFEVVESPAMQIQLGEEPVISEEPKPVDVFTPLKIENIKEIYDREKADYLKIAMKLNAIELESASEAADSENETLIQEIINPAPGLTVDDDVSVDTQFSFANSDLDTSFALSNSLKARLDNILDNARDKISSVNFPSEPIEKIPNDPLYPHSQIKTEDIFIDDSLRDLLYPGDPIYFPQPSTDNRKDFEINIPENEIIVFKLPSLTLASVEKKESRTILNKIIEDLDLHLKQTFMNKSDKTETKQKITLLKNFNKRLDTIKKEDIEKQLQSHDWLTQLVDDQLTQIQSYYNFGENYENKQTRNKFKNVTVRKRKLLPLTSEHRLKELPSIYSKIPVDN